MSMEEQDRCSDKNAVKELLNYFHFPTGEIRRGPC